jgi:RNA polymerase sigma-70 factor (ECF subfamily)
MAVDEVRRRTQLESLFNAHAGAVRAYARRRIDAVAADDVVSEVFVIAWRRLDDVPDDALPWQAHHPCARRDLRQPSRTKAQQTLPPAELKLKHPRGRAEVRHVAIVVGRQRA